MQAIEPPVAGRRDIASLETVDLDSLAVKLKTFLGDKEVLYVLALVALELDHLSHLGVGDDGAIAGCGWVSLGVLGLSGR